MRCTRVGIGLSREEIRGLRAFGLDGRSDAQLREEWAEVEDLAALPGRYR